MNSNFTSRLKQLASEVSGSSPLCIGRSKMDSLAIASYPELTLRDYDFIQYHDKEDDKDICYPVVIFDEIEDGFYCGGQALSDLLTAVDADEELKNELKESGLKLSFTITKTKSNNTYVNFTVL